MTNEEILQLLKKGENDKVEFKKSKNSLPDSVWETYSAFANTDGGIIILGIAEKKPNSYSISGVANPDKIVKEFWNQINNPQKVNINILFNRNVSVHFINNKNIIAINILRAGRQEKPIYINNNIMTGAFRRNADGDYHCPTSEIKAMLRDQTEISADSTIYNSLPFTKLITETFRRYRIRFKNLKPNHIWNSLEDDELLLKIGAVKRADNKLQPTLAGIVMFCNEQIITSILPDYFLDYREKTIESEVRWTDRLQSNSGNWSGNVFDFYFNIIDKILLTTKIPFQLQSISRIDETPFHEAIREAVANTLIHADYHGQRGIVIEKLPNAIRFCNPGNFRIPITTAAEGGISDPRNSTIFKIFSLVGIGERAGSGIYSIHHVWETNKFPKPVLSEKFNPERILFYLQWNIKNKSSGKTFESSGKTSDKIIVLIEKNSSITIPEMSQILKISTRAVEKQLNNLKKSNQIKRIGSAKTGHWESIK